MLKIFRRFLLSPHFKFKQKGCVHVDDVSLEFSSRGLSLDKPLVRACTVVKEHFSSHSIVTKIRSNFSKVGTAMLFVHVNFLLNISISFRLRPSITALNRKGDLVL
jgi:hypothetical protein